MSSNVLVLNQDYQAISICSVERAFVLVLLDKAEMVCHFPEKALRSVGREFTYPSVIRLFRYIRLPFRKVSLTRHNVFKRDANRCVYCGSRDNLTLDHVVPRSKGGKDTWDNLVTACKTCNAEKGNRTPAEAGMKMCAKPYRPSFIMYLRDFTGSVHEEWKPYLLMT